MHKRLNSIFFALLIAVLVVMPVYAGAVSGNIGLGSITFTGWAAGFSRDAVTVTLSAKGIPVISCYNPGKELWVSGQNPVPVTGETSATYSPTFDENGKFDINLEAQPNILNFTPKQLGCPNNNWKVRVDFVYWTYAKLTVTENSTGDVVWQKESSCTTTRNPDEISCPAFE